MAFGCIQTIAEAVENTSSHREFLHILFRNKCLNAP